MNSPMPMALSRCFLPVLLAACWPLAGLLAQQYPGFSQQLYDGSLFQPARRGLDRDHIQLRYRDQWTGMESRYAPRTLLAGTDLTRTLGLADDRIGLGLELMSDRVFVQRNIFAQFSFAYHLVSTQNATLSAGVSAGLLNQRLDLSDTRLYDPQDLVLLEGRPAATGFTGGLGLHYRRQNQRGEVLEIDLTLPQLFNSNLQFADGLRYNPVPHLMLGLGYRLKGLPGMPLEPRLLFRGVVHSGNWQVATDMGLRAFFLDNRYWGALGVRVPGGAFHLALGARLSDRFDLSALMETQAQLGFSFELGLRFRIGKSPATPEQAGPTIPPEETEEGTTTALPRDSLLAVLVDARQRCVLALQSAYEASQPLDPILTRIENLMRAAADPKIAPQDRALILNELNQQEETLLPRINRMGLETRRAGEALAEAEQAFEEALALDIKIPGARRELRSLRRTHRQAVKQTTSLVERFTAFQGRLEQLGGRE